MNKTVPSEPAVQWQLGEVTFDSRTRQLSRGDNQLYLEPRQHQLLLSLLASPELPLSREQLIQTVWQGRIVSDGAINRAVSMLRKAFASLDPTTDYIATLPKLGYQLLSNVKVVSLISPDQTQNSAQSTLHQGAQQKPASVRSGKSRNRLQWLFLLLALIICGLFVVRFWFYTNTPLQLLSAANKVPHTSFNGRESQLSSNAKGTALLYQRQANNGNHQIWLNTLADNKHLALTPDNEDSQNAALSPDGRQFAYVRYSSGSSTEPNIEHCQIVLQTLGETTANRILHQCPPDNAPLISWHSDGNTLYFRQRADKTHPYQLYQLSIASGAVRQLTLLAADYSGQGDIALATSGQQPLAIVRYITADTSELLLLDSNGQITFSQTIAIRATALAWYNTTTVNEDRVLLLSAGSTLYQYHLASAELTPLYHAADAINSFVVTGDNVYFSSTELSADIWQANKAGDALVRINSSRLDTMPRLSHDATQLAFLSDRQGHLQLWLQQVDGTERLLSELPGQPSFIRLEWSDDDKQLLFSKDGAVYSVNIDSGKLMTLLNADKQVAIANWAMDDTKLVYSSQRDGDWQLWLYDLTNNSEQRLTQQGGYSGRIWQNRLYFSKYHQDGLWVKELSSGNEKLSSGSEQLLLSFFDKINWLNWQIDQVQLYYYVPTKGIYRLDLASGESALHLSEPSRFVRHFSVRQNQTVYVRHSELQGDIYRLLLKAAK
ncbi:winged helix-turn-helix domain-containing protein [Rheinheimera salexigens]|uniref:OmpR/PhoB-type domain-containing protein n=1 Tax=Rheinheimera salexigens TaxID=1628148 RepID=A0A1E7Q2L2_9GAMM|nr:winged helix-turn-helix domain-containing protein [Rheinheimera salexigens]OEY68361.1 hypothetical protein BI198_01345 [Rheinheimera salexigens]